MPSANGNRVLYLLSVLLFIFIRFANIKYLVTLEKGQQPVVLCPVLNDLHNILFTQIYFKHFSFGYERIGILQKIKLEQAISIKFIL